MANGDNFQLDPRLQIPVTGNVSGTTPAAPVTFRDLSQYLGKSGATQPLDTPQSTGLPHLRNLRSPIAQELQDPAVRQRLMASTMAEVGDQGKEARMAYIESVMNRSLARNKSLFDTISDTRYYPNTTLSRLGRTFSDSTQGQLNAEINNVLNGSNISGLATGNESGRVRSGGAPITFNPGTGERFVIENPDAAWVQNITKGSQAQPQGQVAQTTASQQLPPNIMPIAMAGGPQWQDLSQYLNQ